MKVELIERFDEMFDGCRQCLIGLCNVDNEAALLFFLLTADLGLYIKICDGLGCSRSTMFSVYIVLVSDPVCHNLQRMSKFSISLLTKKFAKCCNLV